MICSCSTRSTAYLHLGGAQKMHAATMIRVHPDEGYGGNRNVGDQLILTHLLTAIGLPPGGSSTVHIYTKTVHRTTQLTTLVGRLSGIRTQSGQTKINNELTA